MTNADYIMIKKAILRGDQQAFLFFFKRLELKESQCSRLLRICRCPSISAILKKHKLSKKP